MPQRTDRPALAPEAVSRAERLTLANGLQVVLLEDHNAPVVAFQVWVRFGSADEDATYAGVAHVFEHMLFKGTERYPHGEIGGLIEGAGGIVNAWTSYDETVYHTVLASRYWERGFDVLTDAVLHSLLDPEELRRELEVVLEELRRGKDNPDRELWERIMGLAYRRHPYGRPVIGYPETVRAITREALVEIYRRWYVPNNMVFVAVGDFDRAALLAALEERFGAVPAQELPERPRTSEPPIVDGPRVTTFAFDAELARVELAFAGVAATDADAPALDVLAEILGGGYNSRLYMELKRRRDLVVDVSAYDFTPRDPGLFFVGATVRPERVTEATEALAREVAAAAGGLLVSEDELAAAKSVILSRFVHTQETYQGVARTLGNFALYWGDPEAARRYMAAIEAVTPADLARVARTYLRFERAVAAVMVPEGTAPPRPEAVRARLLAAATPVHRLERIGTDPEAHVTLWRLPDGARLVIQEDHKAPLVSVKAVMLGGVRAERPGEEGVAQLLASVWDRGTPLHGAGEIERLLDRWGGRLGAAVNRDVVFFGGRFLRQHLDDGLALFFEVLTDPEVPERELERERADQLEELRALRENRFRYAFARFLEYFYGDHPYGHLTLGTPESVAKLTRAQLLAYHRRLLAPERLVFAVVGDVDAERFAERFAARWAQARRPEPEPLPEVPPVPELDGFREVVLRERGNQTHILWGFPTVDLRSDDRYPLRVLDAILSGMGGRLFVELRDKRSLAYSVTSFDAYPRDRGFLVLYIGCEPSKERAAIAEFERVLREIQEQGVTAEELERAKTYLEGSLAVGLQSTSNRANNYATSLLHFDRWDMHRRYLEAIRAVRAEDVQRVARTYLRPERSLRLVLRASSSGE